MDPLENKRIADEMAKKATEKPVEKIKVKSQIEILDHPVFREHLKQKLEAQKQHFSASPGKDMKWKRNPLMDLKEQGFLDDPDRMVAEFIKIYQKKCTLSAGLRNEIDRICRIAFWNVREKFELIK